MTIQQFAEQLKQEDGASPLLQSLQALRTCDLDELSSLIRRMDGWIPWGVGDPPAAQSVSNRLELRN